jgi:hypothetical protein
MPRIARPVKIAPPRWSEEEAFRMEGISNGQHHPPEPLRLVVRPELPTSNDASSDDAPGDDDSPIADEVLDKNVLAKLIGAGFLRIYDQLSAVDQDTVIRILNSLTS